MNETKPDSEIDTLIVASDARSLLKYANTQKVRELINFGFEYKLRNWKHLGLKDDDIEGLKDLQKGLRDEIKPFKDIALSLYISGKNKKIIIGSLSKKRKISPRQKDVILKFLERLDVYVHLIHVGVAVKLAGLALFQDGDGVIREAYAFPLSMPMAQRRNIVISPINNDAFIQKLRGLNIDRSSIDCRRSQNIGNKKVLQSRYKKLKQQMSASPTNKILDAMVTEIKNGQLPWAQSPNRKISSIESLKKIIFPLPK